MSDQSTQFSGTRHRAYGAPKAKRHLYLTETAYQHLVDLARCANSSPSEVCEQIIRNHIHALAIPSSDVFHLPSADTAPETSSN
jgi:hypothetical protein